eukprot:3989672-Amphidinium_carterae.1
MLFAFLAFDVRPYAASNTDKSKRDGMRVWIFEGWVVWRAVMSMQEYLLAMSANWTVLHERPKLQNKPLFSRPTPPPKQMQTPHM